MLYDNASALSLAWRRRRRWRPLRDVRARVKRRVSGIAIERKIETARESRSQKKFFAFNANAKRSVLYANEAGMCMRYGKSCMLTPRVSDDERGVFFGAKLSTHSSVEPMCALGRNVCTHTHMGTHVRCCVCIKSHHALKRVSGRRRRRSDQGRIQ